jgi:hypothetical protein
VIFVLTSHQFLSRWSFAEFFSKAPFQVFITNEANNTKAPEEMHYLTKNNWLGGPPVLKHFYSPFKEPSLFK